MRGRALRLLAMPALALAAVTAVAGCAGSSGKAQAAASGAAASPAAVCGTSRTAAGVPVTIEIERGSAACSLALDVERAYQRAIAAGKVAGNGGGAPTKIRGWVCQGFNTPQVLATGDASSCRRAGAEILAVLPAPTATATP